MSRPSPAAVRRGLPLGARLLLDVQCGPADECWPWMGAVNSYGYGVVRNHLMHRLAYSMHKGPIPVGLLVRHTCDNPPCCNPAHLLVGTVLDNKLDEIERDRQQRGTRHWKHILNEGVVREARRRYAAGETQTFLAAEYGVRQTTMSSAINGLTWAHVR